MSQHTGLFSTNTEPALGRIVMYRLLSLGFRYPTAKAFECFRDGEYLSELIGNLAFLPHLELLADEYRGLGDRVSKDLRDVAFQDFEVNYVQTFDVGSPKPPCPPYEGLYRETERTATMLEVSQFYKHFGLEMNEQDGSRELPDHLCAELEFLHFLAFKEHQAREQNNAELFHGYRLAQRDFLGRHPTTWLPKFCEKLQGSAAVPFYAQLAELTLNIVRSDLEWLHSENC